MKLVLIDGDNIPFVIGHKYKDLVREDGCVDESSRIEVLSFLYNNVDSYVQAIIQGTQCDKYIGVLSCGYNNFRYVHYKYASYKGQRGDKPNWYTFWEPYILERLIIHWGFVNVPILNTRPEYIAETDDIISFLAYYHKDLLDTDCIICSPDKDLQQIPGTHYNPNKPWDEAIKILSVEEAQFNYLKQLLMGDSTDNIAGIPGLGEVKATKFLKEHSLFGWNYIEILAKVKDQYTKSFGPYYGPTIFKETQIAVELLTQVHPLWLEFFNEWLPGTVDNSWYIDSPKQEDFPELSV